MCIVAPMPLVFLTGNKTQETQETQETQFSPAVDLRIIASIESSNNPLAYNKRSKAAGMYQITPVCLKDYNDHHVKKLSKSSMYGPGKAFLVADWYYNERIPAMLKYYGVKDTLDNRLSAYNWGIGNVVKGARMPKETRDYIKKYHDRVVKVNKTKERAKVISKHNILEGI